MGGSISEAFKKIVETMRKDCGKVAGKMRKIAEVTVLGINTLLLGGLRTISQHFTTLVQVLSCYSHFLQQKVQKTIFEILGTW